MVHPSLEHETLMHHLNELISDLVPDLSGEEKWVGDGARIDIQPLLDCIADIRTALEGRLAEDAPGLDDDQFEGAMAAELHPALRALDVQTLDDPGFWAYLASGPFWFFVKWREDPAKRKVETYHKYLDGRANDSCVPLRMFLRAQAVEQDGDYSLASGIERGVDFWRSHVLRVKTGGKKELARAVARQQLEQRMTVGPVREYAKRVNRRWSNQVLYILDEDECRALAQDERPDSRDDS
jgi:hypothetical protein